MKSMMTGIATVLAGILLVGCSQETLPKTSTSTPASSSIIEASTSEPSSTQSESKVELESTSSSTESSTRPSSTSTPEASKAPESSKQTTSTSSIDARTGLEAAPQAPLAYTGSKQLILADLDNLGRARDAHIQLQDKDEPTGERDSQINVNPVGWRNYNYYYTANDGSVKRAWFFDRGHLVGYQFSGLNDEVRNLVPETAWLNRGAFAGMDGGNQEGMLFYENRLDSWLATHPNYFLDYQVTPLYEGDQLWPQKIRLAYVGIDANGQHLQIRLGSDKEIETDNFVTLVYLDNQAPNATIDFATRQVTNTVEPEKAPVVASSSSSVETVVTPPADASQRIVYITGGGRSEVYWYSKANMPSSTNMNNIIEMTEQQAIDQGKRHSKTE
jgi:DNA-entry nuclease